MKCTSCGLELPDSATACSSCGTRTQSPMQKTTPAARSPGSLDPGVVLCGRYRLEMKLGEGGMGTVFSAHDVELDRKVAVKLLPLTLAADAEVLERFEREARLLAQFDHPNIVPVYDVGRHEGRPFIVMKQLEGDTLAVHLRIKGGLKADEALSVLRQLGAGLDFIHARNFIHRDVKAGNVIVGPTGHVTLLDFGILRTRDASVPITREGMVMGTPHYMAPEQALGLRDVDHRADLYSLGVVLFECFTGSLPFEADSELRLIQLQAHAPPPDLLEKAPWVPRPVAEVVRRALAKRPEDRYPSGKELALALEAAFREPVGAEAAPGPAPAVGLTTSVSWRRREAGAAVPSGPGGTPSGAAASSPSRPPVAGTPPAVDPPTMLAERSSRRDVSPGGFPSAVDGGPALPGAQPAPPPGPPGAPPPQLDPGPGRGVPDGPARGAAPTFVPVESGSGPLPGLGPPGALVEVRGGGPVAGRWLAAGGLAAAALLGVVMVRLLTPGPPVSSLADAAAVAGVPIADAGPGPDAGPAVATHSEAPDAGAPGDAGASAPPDAGGETVPPVADAGSPRVEVRVPPRKSQVRVVTLHQGEPWWAQVFLDGQPRGRTPLQVDLMPGRYTVRVERAGFASVTREIVVSPNRPHVVRIDLSP